MLLVRISQQKRYYSGGYNQRGIIGYKLLNPDFSAFKNHQYEIGKKYKHEGELLLYSQGFHFCLDVKDCLFYRFLYTCPILVQVECSGKIIHARNKSVCSEIRVIRRVCIEER